jgi:hypothetical protein
LLLSRLYLSRSDPDFSLLSGPYLRKRQKIVAKLLICTGRLVYDEGVAEFLAEPEMRRGTDFANEAVTPSKSCASGR